MSAPFACHALISLGGCEGFTEKIVFEIVNPETTFFSDRTIADTITVIFSELDPEQLTVIIC
jgi:hypothetical protein